MANLSRRRLLSGQWRRNSGNTSSIIRPPWSVDEADFTAGCTRCHACVTACETGVLIVGSGGFPEIDFQRAECTFCRRCVTACEASVFTSLDDAPWQWKATFSPSCLPFNGIECRSCQDNCESRAIAFSPRLSGIAQPELDVIACNGCGACVPGCPVQAVTLTRSENGR
ncbi:ferredoxin-type protein NapF [Yersinia ruckeri]|uniref:Ferredoxin-type protein NapF n=1 Tax=Yersinia ruckeri TaxID=29486 RepID=A0A380QSX6_YERRU|nr:ferredoxin-type protein NapF [Yersinia ruckeri]AKA37891.1 ferredoxin [Yersinia ruckeri]ARZ00264.1 ferredoxin-type protein NapF [Yersinia ruckeri]AUQ42376.1 ferredoxin-type protein NapF [Yersinia ruckeri]EKN3346336.1 ferredoxin-type protein NapF [Yersinia ruckeri]EKN3361654.1 ferredoxin-type protein NapF [Yersinia ruckeri]